jgi:hypothetical protein
MTAAARSPAPYVPKGDTLPHQVCLYLQRNPAGELLVAAIARMFDAEPGGIPSSLNSAVRHGLLLRSTTTGGQLTFRSGPRLADVVLEDRPSVAETPPTPTKPSTPLSPNSVFAMGQQAKPKRRVTPLPSADAIEIRKGVPKPDARGKSRGAVYQAIAGRMEVGDSVELPLAQARALCSWAKDKTLKCADSRRWSFARIDDKTGGVWRDA